MALAIRRQPWPASRRRRSSSRFAYPSDGALPVRRDSSAGLGPHSFLLPNPGAFGMEAKPYIAPPVGDIRVRPVASGAGIASDNADLNIRLLDDLPLDRPAHHHGPWQSSGGEPFPDLGPNVFLSHATR